MHVGMPKSKAAYHQQLGRAGRRNHDALSVVLIHPSGGEKAESLFSENPGRDILCKMEDEVLVKHLECAASEIPVTCERDALVFELANEAFKALCEQYLVFDDAIKAFICPSKYRGYPAGSFSLRGSNHLDGYRVVTKEKKDIEFIEDARVPFTLYEGWLHSLFREKR